MIQELRIGNCVYDVHNRVANIVTIGNGTIRLSSKNYHYDSFNTSDISPIPLTEDILLKCGAKLEGSEWQIEYDDTAFIFEGSLGRGFYYTGGEGCKLSVLFYNLHELQNLFRPITGEELNVEL